MLPVPLLPVLKVKDKVDQEMLKMMQEMDEYQHTVERRLQEVNKVNEKSK